MLVCWQTKWMGHMRDVLSKTPLQRGKPWWGKSWLVAVDVWDGEHNPCQLLSSELLACAVLSMPRLFWQRSGPGHQTKWVFCATVGMQTGNCLAYHKWGALIEKRAFYFLHFTSSQLKINTWLPFPFQSYHHNKPRDGSLQEGLRDRLELQLISKPQGSLSLEKMDTLGGGL